MLGLIKKGFNAYSSYKSFKTNRRLFVIESDDWGSLRINDKSTRDALNALSPVIANDNYSQIDNLANVEDLSHLFEALTSVKDFKGNNAILTANVCMANPNFKKIKEDKFTKFHFEPFHKTISKCHNGQAVLDLWSQGQKANIFQPQLHGREHVNALNWLNELSLGNELLLMAFEKNVFSIPINSSKGNKRQNFQAALDFAGHKGEVEFMANWIRESASMFNSYFGFNSLTFIPPAYIWPPSFAPIMREVGIKAVQGIKLHYQPSMGKEYVKKIRYNGSIKYGMTQLVRNVFFEPANQPNVDWLADAKRRITMAYAANEPVILSTHRLNFIGSLNPNNREGNVNTLKQLLNWVKENWEEVEFISSDQLYKIISTD
jgi:hypothetical protein